MNTQLTIDLRSISYCKFFYKNQFGETVRCKPRVPTVHCRTFNLAEMSPYPTVCPETLHGRAKRLDLLDRWTPICIYQFRNNHSITFAGDRAKQRWKQWNTYIYEKKS